MTIEQARQIVAEYIAGWSTQKLADVLCFTEDGRMWAMSSCRCLIGVGTSKILHQKCAEDHYLAEKNANPAAQNIEMAYFRLAWDEHYRSDQKLADIEFLAILRAELERREPLVIDLTCADAVALEVCG